MLALSPRLNQLAVEYEGRAAFAVVSLRVATRAMVMVVVVVVVMVMVMAMVRDEVSHAHIIEKARVRVQGSSRVGDGGHGQGRDL
jgi:hypothetical protein